MCCCSDITFHKLFEDQTCITFGERIARVEVGVKDSFKRKLVRGRLKRAGHVERVGYEKMAKRTLCPESGGKR